MDVSVFSFPINTFKSFSKPSHNVKFVLSSSIFVPHKSAIFNQFDLAYKQWTVFRICFKTEKLRDDVDTALTTDFSKFREKKILSYALNIVTTLTINFFTFWEKKYLAILQTTEATIFIRIIARVFIQRTQIYPWFIANIDRNMLLGYSADNLLN